MTRQANRDQNGSDPRKVGATPDVTSRTMGLLKPMTAVAALLAAVTLAIQPSVPAGANSSSAIFLDPWL